jgi:hypothetical protein
MNLFNGIFAVVQATFPILTALPIVILDFHPPISARHVLNFYFGLLLYFCAVAVLGLLGIWLDEAELSLKSISTVVYVFLLFISARINHQIANWILQELATRTTRWDEELAVRNWGDSSTYQDIAHSRRIRPSSRQNGRRKR